ncbi:MAG TPA: ribonuclease H-like domain-containing protein [Thermoanaerobaculia bacterium]|nr:ribonuclease H-like domain-containing protein [Thermoanaerobaculia bacterium]
MKTVVFDIETVSFPWLELDPLQRERLTRRAEDHEEFLRMKEGGALSPYTGKVIVIAMMNPETGKGIVWHEAPGERASRASEDGFFEYVGCGEKDMLAEFWSALSKFDRFVTFNGRTFDGPFLSVRSAIHGLLPSKNLLGYRYSMETHVDLLEILTFQGAVARDQTPTLHSACVAFGIPSPKSEEMHGYAVGDAYHDGRLAEVAEYCRRDVEATAALFRRLETTLLPLFKR